MKAAVIWENGDPRVLRYETVPDPKCAPDGIVIQVEAVSIEGGDVLNRWRGALATKPHVVGYQAAGEIIEVGSEIADLKVGQKVVTVGATGSHAEQSGGAGPRRPGRSPTVSTSSLQPGSRSRSAPPTKPCSNLRASRRAKPCSSRRGQAVSASPPSSSPSGPGRG